MIMITIDRIIDNKLLGTKKLETHLILCMASDWG